MTKLTKIVAWTTLILMILISLAATSDYWEDFFPFHEGGLIGNIVFFFSTVGVILLVLSLVIFAILLISNRNK